PPPPPGGYPPPPQQGGYPPPPQPSGYPPSPTQGSALPKEAYTPWITRVGGFLIDNIPVFILAGIAWGIAFATGDTVCAEYGYGYGGYCSTSPSGLGLTVVVLAWLVSLAYFVWNYGYRQGTTGSSIGKSVLKFRVVSEKTGQPIGFGMSIVRQLAHIIDVAICYVGFLWPLWDGKRQTLADKIMTTVCLPLERQGLNPQPLPPQSSLQQ
ncbi:MAG TPA: RDD family protein, partial [Mycobacterium sp.]|nr:RDD family protein [Mycobacterium sp.]